MASSIVTSEASMVLDFEGLSVRFVGTADRPAWIAQDVCKLLGLENTSQSIADFDDDEKGIWDVYTIRGKQRLAVVYESGLYRLVTKSRKPEAKRFRKWVFGEVLPSIRKHGCYPPPQNSAYQITLKPYTARVVWMVHVRRQLPKNTWCVFIEGAELLIGAEHILGPSNLEMHQYDLLDGSIGKRWSTYRQDKPWMGVKAPYKYTFPDGDPRGTVTPWAYPMCELEHFKNWLHTEYSERHFPEYIRNKYGAEAYRRALPILAKMGLPLLANPKRK